MTPVSRLIQAGITENKVNYGSTLKHGFEFRRGNHLINN
jgi:hypothetical protein